jgi:hypothetical protein
MDNRYYQHMPVTEDQTKAGQTAVHGNWPFAFSCESPVTGITDVPVFQVALNAAYNLTNGRAGNAPPRAR